MKMLCIHSENHITQLPVPVEINWLITIEFVNHLKKKWPAVHCHIMEEGDTCNENY